MSLENSKQLRGETKLYQHDDCHSCIGNDATTQPESVMVKISGDAYKCVLDMQTRFDGMDLGTLIHTALHTLDFLKTKTMNNHSILIRNESTHIMEKYRFK